MTGMFAGFMVVCTVAVAWCWWTVVRNKKPHKLERPRWWDGE